MKKALLVIDMQNDFIGDNRDKNRFCYKDIDKLISNINSNIEESNKNGDKVIYISHVLGDNFISRKVLKYGISGTEGAQLSNKLKKVSNDYFEKHHGDAFSVKELRFFMENHEIDTVQICGIDEGGCVSLTAKGAAKLGFKVEILKDSVDTIFPMKKVMKFREELKKLGVKYI